MTTYPHNVKLHRTTPDLTIATYTYKRQSGSKHILEDSNSVTVSVSEQQLSGYNLSRRIVLTELEETLRQKIDRVHSELREAGLSYNPVGSINVVYKRYDSQIKEVHQYSISGRYIASFISMRDANMSLGKEKTNSGISKCCRMARPTAYGYRWSYGKRNFF